jgi:hypothetical protein
VCGSGIDHQRGRTEQHPVHDAEHGGVCADAEREGNDDGEGEPRLPPDSTDGVFEVLAKGVDHDRQTA